MKEMEKEDSLLKPEERGLKTLEPYVVISAQSVASLH